MFFLSNIYYLPYIRSWRWQGKEHRGAVQGVGRVARPTTSAGSAGPYSSRPRGNTSRGCVWHPGSGSSFLSETIHVSYLMINGTILLSSVSHKILIETFQSLL